MYRDPSSPKDLLHIKILRRGLDANCGWPKSELGEKPHKYRKDLILFIIYLYVFIFGVQYVRNHWEESGLLELGQDCINLLIQLLNLTRFCLTWIKIYRMMMTEFVEVTHLFHYKHKSKFALKTYKEVKKYCNIICTILEVEIYVGVLLYNIWPLYNNYKAGLLNSLTIDNGTHYEFSVNFVVPYQQNNICVYIIKSLFDCSFSYHSTAGIYGYDLCMCVILLHVQGHIDILNNNLEGYPRAASVYSIEQEEEVYQLLRRDIEYYIFITKFLNKFMRVLGPLACGYYTFYQIVQCIMLLKLSALNMEAFAKFGVMTLFSYQQLFLLSIIFELLRSKTEAIRLSVYNLPWERMRVKNRRMVYVFLMNVQTPNLKALIPLGVQTMAAVFKNTLCYFLMLRNIALDE